MTAKEHKQMSSKIKQITKEVSKDASKAAALLQRTGFYTKNGTLKKACR
jgi:hypothetical protein